VDIDLLGGQGGTADACECRPGWPNQMVAPATGATTPQRHNATVPRLYWEAQRHTARVKEVPMAPPLAAPISSTVLVSTLSRKYCVRRELIASELLKITRPFILFLPLGNVGSSVTSARNGVGMAPGRIADYMPLQLQHDAMQAEDVP